MIPIVLPVNLKACWRGGGRGFMGLKKWTLGNLRSVKGRKNGLRGGQLLG